MERLDRFKDNYSVRVKRNKIPPIESFNNTMGQKPLQFPKQLAGIEVSEVKKKPNQDIEPCFAKCIFSKFFVNTLFGAGHNGKSLIRYDVKRERLVCKSRLEIPRVDSIREDANGSIWVFSFGKEKKIFEFSPKLTMLTHYPIESRRDISK